MSRPSTPKSSARRTKRTPLPPHSDQHSKQTLLLFIFGFFSRRHEPFHVSGVTSMPFPQRTSPVPTCPEIIVRARPRLRMVVSGRWVQRRKPVLLEPPRDEPAALPHPQHEPPPRAPLPVPRRESGTAVGTVVAVAERVPGGERYEPPGIWTRARPHRTLSPERRETESNRGTHPSKSYSRTSDCPSMMAPCVRSAVAAEGGLDAGSS